MWGIEEAAKRIRKISLCKVLICFLRRRDKPPSKPADTAKEEGKNNNDNNDAVNNAAHAHKQTEWSRRLSITVANAATLRAALCDGVWDSTAEDPRAKVSASSRSGFPGFICHNDTLKYSRCHFAQRSGWKREYETEKTCRQYWAIIINVKTKWNITSCGYSNDPSDWFLWNYC